MIINNYLLQKNDTKGLIMKNLSFKNLLFLSISSLFLYNLTITPFSIPRTVNAKVGGTFKLKFPASDSIGWEVEIEDENIANLIRARYEKGKVQHKRSLYEGIELFEFKALVRGRTTVIFEKIELFEKDMPHLKQKKLMKRVITRYVIKVIVS